MAVRRRVLKYKPAVKSQQERMERLLEKKPGTDPERERFFAELISKTEGGRLPEAERRNFIGEFVALRKEDEEEEQRPKKRFGGGTNLRERISYKIRRFKKRK